MAVKKEDVLVYLENANMMEVSELISEIEEKFGVSAAAPVAVAAAPAVQSVPAPAAHGPASAASSSVVAARVHKPHSKEEHIFSVERGFARPAAGRRGAAGCRQKERRKGCCILRATNFAHMQ